MKKIFVIFALFCVFFLVSCGDGSKKVDTNDSGDSTSDNSDSADSASDKGDTGNSGSAEATKEGVYLGIIGFNEELFQENKYSMEIGLLNSSTESGYTSFINNLYASKGTALYYADYKALEMMGKSSIPPKLQKVALVTFTDGLDNLSTDEYDPENYDDPDLYLNAIHDKIVKEKIHGKSVEAFSIGLKGREEGVEPAQFEGTLKKLASSDSKAFLVSDMDEVMEHFDIIAKSLYSATTTVNLAVLLPGGYKDGEVLRFTFDNPNSAADSELYIEATFRKTDKGRSLEKISYEGFAKGEATIQHKEKEGAYYRFVFEDMKYDDGKAPAWSESELRNILKLWKQNSSGGWYTDSEFDPASSSKLEEERSSALIMLVLDCTTSLGSDFSRMQEIAKDFVKTLVNGSSTGNGNGNGNNAGDGGDNSGDSENPDQSDSSDSKCREGKLKWENCPYGYHVMFKSVLDDKEPEDYEGNSQGDTCKESSTYILNKTHIPADATIQDAYLVWTAAQPVAKKNDITDKEVILSFSSSTVYGLNNIEIITGKKAYKISETDKVDFEFDGFQDLDEPNKSYYTYRVKILDFFKEIQEQGRNSNTDIGQSLLGEYTISGLDCTEDKIYKNSGEMVADWSIILIYSSAENERKNIYIYNDFKKYWYDQTEITVSGFELPADSEIRITLASHEGEMGLVADIPSEEPVIPESLKIQGLYSDDWLFLSNECNPQAYRDQNYDHMDYTEIFNSISSVYGYNDTKPTCIGGTPPNYNTDEIEFGMDVDTFLLNSETFAHYTEHFHEGDNKFEISIGANKDAVIINYLVVSVSTKN